MSVSGARFASSLNYAYPLSYGATRSTIRNVLGSTRVYKRSGRPKAPELPSRGQALPNTHQSLLDARRRATQLLFVPPTSPRMQLPERTLGWILKHRETYTLRYVNRSAFSVITPAASLNSSHRARAGERSPSPSPGGLTVTATQYAACSGGHVNDVASPVRTMERRRTERKRGESSDQEREVQYQQIR